MNTTTQDVNSTSRSDEITHITALRRLRYVFFCLALLLLMLGGGLFFMSLFMSPHLWALLFGGVGLLTLLASLLVFLLGLLLAPMHPRLVRKLQTEVEEEQCESAAQDYGDETYLEGEEGNI